jgi:hypothetical protein
MKRLNEDRLQPVPQRHGDRSEVVQLTTDGFFHASGSVRAPHSTSVDARQRELLLHHAEHARHSNRRYSRPSLSSMGACDAMVTMSSIERRSRRRDLGGVHADAGAVADQRAAVDQEVH